MSVPESCGARRPYAALSVHASLGELRASGVGARLHLAALHAACDGGAPEPLAGVCGAEAACELLRRSWTSRPLTEAEGRALANVARLSRSTPALRLLCRWMRKGAQSLAAFHPGAAAAPADASADDDSEADADADAASEYLAYVARGNCSPRRLLTAEEAAAVLGCQPLGFHQLPRPWPLLRSLPGPAAALPPPPPLAVDVAAAERELRSMVVDEHVAPCDVNAIDDDGDFPLDARHWPPGSVDPLLGDMLAELRASVIAHRGLARPRLAAPVNALRPRIRALLLAVEADAGAAEAHALSCCVAEAAPGHAALGWRVPACRLLRAAGRLPAPTRLDLLRLLVSPDAVLAGLNPFVAASASDVVELQKAASEWAQRVVLRDKLRRLARMCDALSDAAARRGGAGADAARAAEAALLRELCAVRVWDAAAHPEWLAFELDGGLRIRPEQHCLAEYVMKNDGAIVQLNSASLRDKSMIARRGPSHVARVPVGEGKTRVVMPMIVLHYARRAKSTGTCRGVAWWEQQVYLVWLGFWKGCDLTPSLLRCQPAAAPSCACTCCPSCSQRRTTPSMTHSQEARSRCHSF